MSEFFAPLREREVAPTLPPEAVRRRGDRLRRRRTGLHLLAAGSAVAVVVVGGFWVAGGTDPDPPPGPADSQGPIPPELDLADGRPRQPTSSQAPDLVVCGVRHRVGESATAVESVSWVETGDITARTLAVYPDAAAARAAATALVNQFRSCPRSTDRRGREVVTAVRRSGHGERSWVAEQQWNAPRHGADFPQVLEVVQVDESVLVVQQRELHGVRLRDLRVGTGLQVEWLLDHQLCLLTEGGCSWRSDPNVLRPDGWGPWRLGMTRDELEDAGAAVSDGDAGSCTAVDLSPGSGMLADDRLVTIQVPEGVTTPDGIGVGSRADDVSEVYWFEGPTEDGVRELRASPAADYVVTVERGRVAWLALADVAADCVIPAGGGSRR